MYGDRLKQLRLSRKLNMKETAEQLGIVYTTYVGYEKNEREPSSDVLVKIADFFNCSTDYLLGNSEHIEPQGKISNAISSKEKIILNKYRKLDTYGQKTVDSVIDCEYERCTTVKVYRAANSEDNHEDEIVKMSKDVLEKLKNAPMTDEDL